MTSYFSIPAWRIPWIEEPGGLQSMGSQSWTRLSACVHTHTHTQLKILHATSKTWCSQINRYLFWKFSLLRKKKRNISVGLGQGPGSPSRDIHNIISEIFCRTKTATKHCFQCSGILGHLYLTFPGFLIPSVNISRCSSDWWEYLKICNKHLAVTTSEY